MKQDPSTLLGRGRRRRRRSPFGQVARGSLLVLLGFAGVVALVAAGLYARLAAGPLSFNGLPDRVAGALAERIGSGWGVSLRGAALQLDGAAVALHASGLDIRNPQGALVVRAPEAVVSVGVSGLLAGAIQPRSVEFRGLHLLGVLNRDGSVAFAPADDVAGQAAVEAAAAAPAPAGTDANGEAAPSPLAVAIGSLLELALDRSGVIGALDRAELTDARLSLVDANRVERAAFEDVDATFERAEGGGRRVDMRLRGPRGEWRVAGTARDDDGRRVGDFAASDVPIQDLLLLSGQSGLPAATDLKMSGRATATLRAGRLVGFDARFVTGAGLVQIDDKDMPPIRVDQAAAEASWDEGRRALLLRALDYADGATRIRLQGELTPRAGDADWRLDLSGRDAVLKGATPADSTVPIETIELSAVGREGGLVLERLAVRGPELAAEVGLSVGTPADREGLRVRAKGAGTGVRRALRVWPDLVVPKVRRYLVENARAGTVENFELAVALSGEDLRMSMSGGPIPDEAVDIRFAIKNGELRLPEGLPSLVGLSVGGKVTGLGTSLQAPTARAPLPEGRELGLADGAFTVANFWPDDAAAAIGFRIAGGADAAGTLLNMPALRQAAGVELDPATTKGEVDLRVGLTLPFRDIPAVGDLPLTVQGTVKELAIDKAFGRERLEGGALSVSYDRGALNVRGEARMAGSPAVIDIRQPRGGAGEASVLLQFDEAARARKGLSFGPQLAGVTPLRVTLPLSKGVKANPKVEIDLSRAAIDNLLPGWVKPAGRPGKLSFVLNEDKGQELRDLVLDSGPVQLRGQVFLSAEGTLERADIAALKLSPGDDLRAQVERAGGVLRVGLRGNVGDARPLLRSFTSPSGGGRSGAKTREGPDVDLDVNVNILTGHNEEALTNVSAKVSSRRGDLRQLQLSGRLRGAAVAAQLSARDRGAPTLHVQSQDAGATLRFLDIYKRMSGGDLALQVSTADGPQAGTMTIGSFALRDEPALRRIIPGGPQAQVASSDPRIPALDTAEVAFTALKVSFTRTASKLDFRDAAIYGPAVGFKLDGWIDYVRDRADIAGTFVPAYALNNIFSQVPLFGPLLGGGRDEGLFAVTFRITGLASSPTLTVNPLSAVAPGFLRKIFGGVGSPTDPAAPTPGSGGAAPPRAAPPRTIGPER
jgi:hypothetical protein